MKYTIRHLPEEERPREKLVQKGSDALSLAELIAIILGSGTKEKSVLELSQEILASFGSLEELAEATVEELKQIKGVGPAKAIQLKAAFGIAKRLCRKERKLKSRVDTASQAYELMKDHFMHQKKELFAALLQDVRGRFICVEVISVGTLSQSLVHPREVFYPAIRHKAASMIVAHNHPSGDITPSFEDLRVTQILVETGKLVGIPVTDHLIVSDTSFISLRQKGLIKDTFQS